MVKGAIAILAIAAGILAAVYYLGGISSYNPTERGREAKAALSPGMKWTKVVEHAGEPAWYRLVEKTVKTGPLGVEMEVFEPGAKMAFDRQRVERDIADAKVPYGFVFEYFFSAQVAFHVWHDSNGVVESIVDTPTIADLLQTRGD
jgi:hypothetical protein